MAESTHTTPVEASPDVVGGWDAESCKEYFECDLRQAVKRLVELYGESHITALLANVITELDAEKRAN